MASRRKRKTYDELRIEVISHSLKIVRQRDLLDECERMLVVGVEVTCDDFAEGIGRWRDEVKATLAKLRAAQEKADE